MSEIANVAGWLYQRGRRVQQAGPDVAAYRLRQAGDLYVRRRAGYWRRLPQAVAAHWSAERVEQWLTAARRDELLIGPASLAAVRRWGAEHPAEQRALLDWAGELQRGQFSIFGQAYQFDVQAMPWHSDWRWDHTWPPADYQSYRFYIAGKPVPYDVHFPWELSRLACLLPVAQAAALTGDLAPGAWISALVLDWERRNPLAGSVNWRAMEVSMRGINLALAAQMLAAGPATDGPALAPLLRLLALHGEFLYRNVEYTDVRGNHYAANLVALLLLGHTLQGSYAPAASWTRHAAARLCREIELQFCEDGVNFEKSVGYHRLVTELCLLGLITLEKMGLPVSAAARTRIERACEYARCYIRPDGLAPVWGDDDGACVLGFERRPARDHRALLALAAAYFGRPALEAAADSASACIPWLLGAEWQRRWDAPVLEAATPAARLFPAGGMLSVRQGGNYLLADYGEVGFRGRGGHGHNDTFSFELCLGGSPLIVDAGCPTYTGDLAAHDRFRGTRAHNTAQVDGREMAELLGSWRIAPAATPRNVQFEAGADCVSIRGEHTGYPGLLHGRELAFDSRAGRLSCRDTFRGQGAHLVERYLHFAPGVQLDLRDSHLIANLTGPGGSALAVSVRWQAGTQATLQAGEVSAGYGQSEAAPLLVLQDHIAGNAELSFEIQIQG